MTMNDVKVSKGNSPIANLSPDHSKSPLQLRLAVGAQIDIANNQFSGAGGFAIAGLSVIARNNLCVDMSARFTATASNFLNQLLVKNPNESETKTSDSSMTPTLGGGGALAAGYCGDLFHILVGPQLGYQSGTVPALGSDPSLESRKLQGLFAGLGLTAQINFGSGFFGMASYEWGRAVYASSTSEGNPRVPLENYSGAVGGSTSDVHTLGLGFGKRFGFGKSRLSPVKTDSLPLPPPRRLQPSGEVPPPAQLLKDPPPPPQPPPPVKLPPPVQNRAPIAKISIKIIKVVEDKSGKTRVLIDGGKSYDPDEGDRIKYQWKVDGRTLSEGSSFSDDFMPGKHQVEIFDRFQIKTSPPDERID